MKKVHSILVTTKFCMCKAATKGKKTVKLYTNKKLKLEKTPTSSCKSKLEQEERPSSSNLNSKSNFRHRTAIFSNEQNC